MRIVAIVVSLCAASALAHDQWLEVQTSPSAVTARLFLGDGTTVEERLESQSASPASS